MCRCVGGKRIFERSAVNAWKYRGTLGCSCLPLTNSEHKATVCFSARSSSVKDKQEEVVTTVAAVVRTVVSHLEYLDNRSRGLDVTWQPVG